MLSLEIESSLSNSKHKEQSLPPPKVERYSANIEVDKKNVRCLVPRKGRLRFESVKHVRDALELFFHPIILDGYTCGVCKKGEKCKQEFYLLDAPKFLIINLKRYSLFTSNTRKDPIINDFKLSLEQVLICREGVETESEYELYGVIEHTGTATEGHYLAYVKGKTK